MDLTTIRSRTAASPFVPFTLNRADGRAFRVSHPEFVAFPPEGRRYVIVFLKDEATDFEMIDPLLVTSLQIDKPGSNGSSNGHRRNKRKPRPNGFAGVAILALLLGVAIILFIAFAMPTGPVTPPAGTTAAPAPGAANTNWQPVNPAVPKQQGVQGGGYLGAVSRGNAKSRETISAISAVEMARLAAIYEVEHGRYPKSVEDLGYDATVLKDQWGTPLFFEMGKDETTGRAVIIVQSAGPDAIANTEDDLQLAQPMPF